MDMPTYEEICATLRDDESLSRVAEDLIRLIRPAIRMVVDEVPIDEDIIPIGTSKLGGMPDLPDGWEWPKAILDVPAPEPGDRISLPFIAQIRLTELAGLLPASPLPASGILYFFYWDMGICRVLYCPEESTPLNRRTPPGNLPEDQIYGVRSVSFEVMHLLPKVETTYIGEPDDNRGVVVLNEEEWGLYADIKSEAISNADHLLGYSQDGQPYAMEGSYLRHRSQLFPDLPDWTMLSAEEQQTEYRGCSLLLQVEPHTNEMHFGRAGALFIFIRNQDLARRDFSRAWECIQ